VQALGLVAALGLAACGPPAERAIGAPSGGHAAPRVVRPEGAPALGVAATGGPSAVVVALSVRGPEESAGLAAYLDARLARTGLSGRFTVRARFDSVDVELMPRALEADVRALVALLREKVSDGHTEALEAARRRVAGLSVSPAGEAHARCRGEAIRLPTRGDLGKAADANDSAAFAKALEAARDAAVAVGPLSVGVAGSADSATLVERALVGAGPWGRRDRPARIVGSSFPAGPGPAPRELHLSFEAPLGARAFYAARALRRPSGDLASVVGREGGVLAHVMSSHAAGSSCLDVVVTFPADRPFAPRLGALAENAERAVVRALAVADARYGDDAAPAERALHAAYLASGPERAERSVARTVLAGAELEPRALPASPPRPAAERALTVNVGTADREGPWVAIVAPCAALDETSRDAGLAALAMASAARRAPEVLSPIVTSRGIGLLARAPKEPGETSRAHVTRLLEIAASALSMPADAPTRRAERARSLAAATKDRERLLATLAEIVAPGRSSMLSPRGGLRSLGEVTDEALVARHVALAEGPLVVHAFAGEPAGELEALAKDVAGRYALGGGGACRAFEPKVPPSVRTQVRAIAPRGGDDYVALAFVDPTPRPLTTLHAVARLVSARDALGADLTSKTRELRAEVAPLGAGAVLVVHFSAARESSNEIIALLRKSLARIGDSAPEGAVRAAIDPGAAARAGELPPWLEARPSTTPPRVDDVRAAARAMFPSGGIVAVLGSP
jgi:hypothetical protein